jgi:hypothetical protein
MRGCREYGGNSNGPGSIPDLLWHLQLPYKPSNNTEVILDLSAEGNPYAYFDP